MQLIFDFIWNQSRGRFLAAIGTREVEQWSNCQPFSRSSASASSLRTRWTPIAPMP